MSECIHLQILLHLGTLVAPSAQKCSHQFHCWLVAEKLFGCLVRFSLLLENEEALVHAVDQLYISLESIVFLLLQVFRIYYDHGDEGAEQEEQDCHADAAEHLSHRKVVVADGLND